MTTPKRRLAGLRASIPSGFFLGRVSSGEGDVELVSAGQAKASGLVPSKLPPMGPAGGDLSGTYPNPTVAALQGNAVQSGVPTNQQVLMWITSSLKWVATTIGLIPAGGTINQVLTKNSSTNYDMSWQNPAGGGAPSSIKDDGTNVYIGVQDSNGQLVLDSSGDPVFVHEVFSPSAVPPLVGVTNGSNAAAGVVGQIVTSGRVTGVALTSGTQTNITSIVLTPGDWDVFGNFYISVSGTASAAEGAISTTSGTVPALGNLGIARLDATYTTNGDFGLPCGTVPMSVPVNTTVYLVAFCVFTGGPVNANGTLSARRMR